MYVHLCSWLNIFSAKWVEAEPFCTKALSIREKILGADHPDVAMALMGIGGIKILIVNDIQRWK